MYLPVYSFSVSVMELKIVDRGVLALAGGYGRYADVIHPDFAGMSTLPFYCTGQIKGVKQLRIFPFSQHHALALFIPV